MALNRVSGTTRLGSGGEVTSWVPLAGLPMSRRFLAAVLIWLTFNLCGSANVSIFVVGFPFRLEWTTKLDNWRTVRTQWRS